MFAYATDVTYTIPFVLDNRVPSKGYIRVVFPASIAFSGTPSVTSSNGEFTGLKSSGTVAIDGITHSFIESFAASGAPAGDNYILLVTNMRNPRSIEPTQGFAISTYDQDGNLIAEGTGGNIIMTAGGTFTELALTATNTSNGATSDYEIKWKAAVPIFNQDTFFLTFPSSMDLPSSPLCSKVDNVACPDGSVSC